MVHRASIPIGEIVVHEPSGIVGMVIGIAPNYNTTLHLADRTRKTVPITELRKATPAEQKDYYDQFTKG